MLYIAFKSQLLTIFCTSHRVKVCWKPSLHIVLLLCTVHMQEWVSTKNEHKYKNNRAHPVSSKRLPFLSLHQYILMSWCCASLRRGGKFDNLPPNQIWPCIWGVKYMHIHACRLLLLCILPVMRIPIYCNQTKTWFSDMGCCIWNVRSDRILMSVFL